MRFSLLALACTTLFLASPSAQQAPSQGQTPPGQPAVTFKAEVNYVDVDAVVTDAQGNFLKGLTKNDFEVFEDGKPQSVEMFSFVDLPVRTPERANPSIFAGKPIVNDVKTNEQSLAGRLYVIVLDDLDTSFFRASTVKRNAREFVEKHLGPDDVAAVVYTSGRSDAAQEFTSDRQLLLAAVDKFIGRKLRSATLDKIDTFFSVKEIEALANSGRDPNAGAAAVNSGSESSGSSTDPMINPYTRGDGYPDRTFDSEDVERGQRALGVLNDIKNIADFLGNVRGRRKAMLLFSEGIDYDINDVFKTTQATAVVRATQDAITAAARGNVSIFGIDPRGLVGMSSEAVGELDSMGTVDDPAQANNFLMGFQSEMRVSQDSLRSLSDETGGFAATGVNDPSAFFDRLVRANSTYYVLGYYPPSHPRDGRFHKIEVRVKRPGAKVSARKGYADPRGKTPDERMADEREKMLRNAKKGGVDNTTPELREILNSPMQQGGVAMLVQAAPFKSATKDASVALAIEIGTNRFRFEPRSNNTLFVDKVELSYFGLNEQGKPLNGQRREMELSLKADTYRRAQQTGLRINERVTLAPGRYQLRIGLREANASALGTVFYDLLVPDFTKEAVSLSGMLLTSSTSAVVPGLIPDKVVPANLLPGPATGRRTFGQGDTLAVYAEIYDNVSAKQTHSLEIVARLTGEDGRSVFTSRETHESTTFQGTASSTTIGFAKQIPLTDVAPGRYLLHLEAIPRGAKDAKPSSRETVITVVAPSGQ